MNKEETIITLVCAVISSGILNVLISHFLYRNKLKNDQKVSRENMINEKITDALLKMRDLELKCKAIEIYDLEDEISKKGFSFFNNQCRYLEILSDEDHFDNFTSEIAYIRENYERYLGFKESALLFYIDTYCMDLRVYMGNNQLSYPVIGVMFTGDFINWHRCCEKVIVAKLNKYNHKILDKNDARYKKEQKRIRRKIWKKSLLYKLLNEPNSIESEVVNKTIIHPNEYEAEKLLAQEEEYRRKHKISYLIRSYKNKVRYK